MAHFHLQDAYAKYVKNYFLGSFGSNVRTYIQKHLKNTTLGEDSADRLWWFQVCTEVAYFQVAPANDSIRSSKVDIRYFSSPLFIDFVIVIVYHISILPFSSYLFTNNSSNHRYHLDLCKNVFGEGFYPDVDTTNIYYGGTKIAGVYSRLLFWLPLLHFSVLYKRFYAFKF